MTVPNTDEFYRTVMHRSWKNYQCIKELQANGEDVHDATQLIATLFLAVCYPIEREIGSAFRHLLISDAENHFGLPKLPKMQFTQRRQKVPGHFSSDDLASHPQLLSTDDVSRDFDAQMYLGDYLEILRHAIAHGHIAYFARKNPTEVDTIEFRNIRASGVNDWVEIPINVIEQLILACMRISEVRYTSTDNLKALLQTGGGTTT